MTYFHLLDRTNGEHMHTGFNSKTKENLKSALLSYYSPSDFEEEDFNKLSNLPVEELADIGNFEIEETSIELGERE